MRIDSQPDITINEIIEKLELKTTNETVYTIYQGGTTSDQFADYLKNILAPTLHKNNIVVMDNMRTHHSKEVKKVIEEL